MKKLLTSIAICVASISAGAESFVTGDKLYSAMLGTPEQQAMANGYVLGAVDVFNGMLFCLPKDVTPTQILQVVGAVLEENPQVRTHGADLIILNIFKETFQCPKPGVPA
jgi:hypothetical protein